MVSLIEFNAAFPETPEREIPLDSTINALQRRFGPGSESIVLVGPCGSGKTAHLSQFARQFPEQCFTYFFTDSYWSWNQNGFLSSLCRQMSAALGFETQLDVLDLERLKTLFGNLCQRVIEQARRRKISYYFVLDGLDLAFRGTPGERVADLLPLPSHPKHLGFLGSIRDESADLLSFPFRREDPHLFSLLDTQHYLEDLHLGEKDWRYLHHASNGIPGYLSSVRQLLIQGITVAQIRETPSQIEALTKMQWNNAGIEADPLRADVIALIAFSLVSLTGSQIATILDLPISKVTQAIEETGLLKNDARGFIGFHSEFLKRTAEERLHEHRALLFAKLIHYYEPSLPSPEASVLLPQYYLQAGDYSALSNVLTPTQLVPAIEAHRDLSVARRNLRQASEMAADAHDSVGILRFAMAAAELQTLSEQLVGESEVSALVSLGKFDEALELAYSATLIEARIHLLSRVYGEMQRSNRFVSREALSEVERMAQSIGQNVDPDQVLRLAVVLFPLLPDTATTLVESVKGREGSANLMDVAAALASIGSESQPNDQLIDKIQDITLREIAVTHAPWLSRLSAQDVLNRARQMKQTKAKEYLLRNWCLQNQTALDIHLVLEEALNTILADPDYVVPLRNLRQLSEALRNCSASHCEILANRFDIPNFTSLKSPVDERLRLELNLAEAISSVSRRQAIERFQEVYDNLRRATLDLDLECYCYVRVLIALQSLDPENALGLEAEVSENIQRTFSELLRTSADQLEIVRRILRSLAAVRPPMALDFASRLNSFTRREEGSHEVVLAYVAQKRKPVEFAVIRSGIERFVAQRYRDDTVIAVIARLVSSGSSGAGDLLRSMLPSARGIVDPIVRCDALALLMTAFGEPADEHTKRELFDDLLNAWNQIEVVWQRVELGFHLVKHVAECDRFLAHELYQKTRALRDTSSLASQPIGSMFYQLLDLAARAAAHIDPSAETEAKTWTNLVSAINHLPAPLLRAQLLGRVALGRLRQGDKNTFDHMIRNEVLPLLRNAENSDMRLQITANLGAAIFEYSRSEAERLLNDLPRETRNAAWLNAALLTLAGANIGDPLDTRSPNTSIDPQVADKAIAMLNYITEDTALHTAIQVFCRSVENHETSLTEAQQLDILGKLEILAVAKLPDANNIQHSGYLVLCQSAIERTRWKCAKRSKSQLKKKYPQIIRDASAIPNIADEVFVLAHISTDIQSSNPPEAEGTVSKARNLISSIPNVRDRIDRAKVVAETLGKLHRTDAASEVIRLAFDLTRDFQGVPPEEVMASIIQTAHQIDPSIAGQLAERIEGDWQRITASQLVESLDIARSPQRLVLGCVSSAKDAEALPLAAHEMLQDLLAGRGVVQAPQVLESALCSLRWLDFRDALKIAHWVIEAMLRQTPKNRVGRLATSVVDALLQCGVLLYELGNRVAFLSAVPQGIKQGFQGLSTKMEVFRVGERERALDWIRHWIGANAREYVKIVDPYFDPDQLWLLQAVPVDLQVTIATTWRSSAKGGTLKPTSPVQTVFRQRWDELSDQDAPSTLIVIHDPAEDDEYHDRYILSREAGLCMGTSLNGIGKKESVVTILAPEDVAYIEENYVNNKLDVQRHFSRMTFFKLQES